MLELKQLKIGILYLFMCISKLYYEQSLIKAFTDCV